MLRNDSAVRTYQLLDFFFLSFILFLRNVIHYTHVSRPGPAQGLGDSRLGPPSNKAQKNF